MQLPNGSCGLSPWGKCESLRVWVPEEYASPWGWESLMRTWVPEEGLSPWWSDSLKKCMSLRFRVPVENVSPCGCESLRMWIPREEMSSLGRNSLKSQFAEEDPSSWWRCESLMRMWVPEEGQGPWKQDSLKEHESVPYCSMAFLIKTLYSVGNTALQKWGHTIIPIIVSLSKFKACLEKYTLHCIA